MKLHGLYWIWGLFGRKSPLKARYWPKGSSLAPTPRQESGWCQQSYGQSQGGSLGTFKAPYTPQGKFPGPSKAGCLCDSPASASSPAVHSHKAKVSRCSSCPLFFLSSVWLPLLLALKTQLVDNLWKPSLLLPTRLGPLIKITYASIHPHIYFPLLINPQ